MEKKRRATEPEGREESLCAELLRKERESRWKF